MQSCLVCVFVWGEREGERELILSFSVVFYLARAVYKFDFRFVTKCAPNKWRPSDRDGSSNNNFLKGLG